jgi:hypothetical protein
VENIIVFGVTTTSGWVPPSLKCGIAMIDIHRYLVRILNYSLSMKLCCYKKSSIALAGKLTAILYILIVQAASAQDPILAWTQYSGMEGESIAVVSDADVNSYVTKEILRDGNKNVLTIKYNTLGTELWRQEFVGLHRRDDSPVSITLDASNNVYVLASTVESADKAAMVLIKYSTTGVPLWTRFYRRPVTHTYPEAVTVDSRTNEIVVCAKASLDETGSPTTLHDYGILTLKYSSAGAIRWERFFISPRRGTSAIYDEPNVLKVDAAGNIFVGGKSVRSPSFPIPPHLGDQLLLKYSPAGTKLWERYFNYDISIGREPQSADEITDLAFDGEGNIYVAGCGVVEAFHRNYGSIAKFRSIDGEELWREFKWEDRESAYPQNARIAFYNNENIYLAFQYEGAIVTTKFNSSGRMLWDRKRLSTVRRDIDFRSVQVDLLGNVTVGGAYNLFRHVDSRSTFYATVVQYNPLGEVNWDISPTWGSTHSDLTQLLINTDNTFFIIGARRFGVGGLTRDYVEKYRFPLPSPPPGTPSTIIMPESFESFERVDFDIYARDRDWCWTDLLIGWECLVPPFCSDPFFSAQLTYNDKPVWHMDFNKPLDISLPLNKDFQRFTLAMKVDDKLRDVIIVDDNLIKNGLERISFSTNPKEKFVTIKATTVNGVEVPFSMTLTNKEGKSIWHETFVAPVEKDISDLASEPGVMLKFSGSSELANINYYPNPFSEQLNVVIDNVSEGSSEVSIYSLQGKKILQQPVDKSGSTTIKMTGQKPGLYILVLKTEFSETRNLVELK